jgi:hypothetical protein
MVQRVRFFVLRWWRVALVTIAIAIELGVFASTKSHRTFLTTAFMLFFFIGFWFIQVRLLVLSGKQNEPDHHA